MASIRDKIVAVGVGGTMATAALLTTAGAVQSGAFADRAVASSEQLTSEVLDQVTTGAYDVVRTQGELIGQSVRSQLAVAGELAGRDGGIRQGGGAVTWKAVNQLSKAESSVTLPRLMLGETWFGQNRDLAVNTPLVDQVKTLTGATVTVFQRMNDQGDMLRVATNVPTLEKKRALGTYIPVVGGDGKPSPVLAKVLEGETFFGTAFVVNAWYDSAYQPIKDATGRVTGVLYVGVQQQSVPSLRASLTGTDVGANGHVMVLGTSGTRRGTYLVAPEGAKDGDSALDVKDAGGAPWVQQVVEAAPALKGDTIGQVR
ncbi:MAG TPA: Cache 3/Cache 2 fusion domain-containing protein, partial [Actinomycetales bacterium]